MAELMNSKQPSRLVLVQLNELSFDMVQRYVDRLGLKSFPRLMEGHFISTRAEPVYDLLEPWIQWPAGRKHTAFETQP